MQLFPVRPNDSRAKAALICLVLTVVVDSASAIVSGWQYYLLGLARNGNYDQPMMEFSDTLSRVIACISLAMLVITCVIFIRWFRRAYFNLHIYNPTYASLDEGWAAGSWFVPIQNFIRPLRIMREIWKGSLNILNTNPDSNSSTARLNAWWIAWLVNNVLGQISFRLYRQADDIASFQTALECSFAVDIASIIGALLLMRIVQKIRSRELEIETASADENATIFGISSNPDNAAAAHITFNSSSLQ